MELKKHFLAIEKSKEYLDWKKTHPKSFLAHIFRMIDGVQDPIWQFGFYNADDTMTTFFLAKTEVTLEPDQEILKANPIHEVKLTEAKIDFSAALEAALKFQNGMYPKHEPLKTIAILQVITGQLLYNITFITQKFDTLNLRISAQDGSIIQEKLTSLADMMKVSNHDDKPDYVG